MINKTIYKYSIKYEDGTRKTFKLPNPSTVLFVEKDPVAVNTISIWVELPIGYKEETERTFELFGTGQMVPLNYIYCGTVIDRGVVLHVYEAVGDRLGDTEAPTKHGLYRNPSTNDLYELDSTGWHWINGYGMTHIPQGLVRVRDSYEQMRRRDDS